MTPDAAPHIAVECSVKKENSVSNASVPYTPHNDDGIDAVWNDDRPKLDLHAKFSTALPACAQRNPLSDVTNPRVIAIGRRCSKCLARIAEGRGVVDEYRQKMPIAGEMRQCDSDEAHEPAHRDGPNHMHGRPLDPVRSDLEEPQRRGREDAGAPPIIAAVKSLIQIIGKSPPYARQTKSIDVVPDGGV